MNQPETPLSLQDYQPRSKLHARQTRVEQPRYPVIDFHNHLGDEFGGGWRRRPIVELLDLMDRAAVRTLVDLDGGWGENILHARLDKYKSAAPERFCFFGGVDWAAWRDQGNRFGEFAARRLEAQASWGAQGLKIWKNLGLQVRDQRGYLIRINDPRLDPLFETAGALRLPVVIHSADPAAFFDPIDAQNERWEELRTHPDWHFPSPPYPPFDQILADLADRVERHPQTVFVGAHVGCCAENLDWVSGLLERCPNFYVDISARISELGRQPYRARRFFLDFPDRILFGMDQAPDLESYQLYFRFLETADEYFEYSIEAIPPQGRWRIYGLYLPDEVLRRVYRRNAELLLELPTG